MKTIYLVACCATKDPRREPLPAKDRYVSQLYGMARRHVEAQLMPSDQWFILSAEHGLLPPDTPIHWYDTSLHRMGAEARLQWAKRVWQGLRPQLAAGDRVVFFAGRLYRENLYYWLNGLPDFQVAAPMAGLGIGHQLGWLAERWRQREIFLRAQILTE